MDPRDRSPHRLSGEDLGFWWLDSPMQPTTMAMLMRLDCAPDSERLRLAFERAVDAVPRLAQRVADAPFDITLPHWQDDPTFDLDYHVRHHRLSGAADLAELFHEVAPAYESPFDRSRPLWEARVYEGLGPEKHAALFFKLHHCVADGIGGNAIFAAMTDWQRDPEPSSCPLPAAPHAKQGWGRREGFGRQLLDAIEDRIALDVERARHLAGSVAAAVEHPERLKEALEVIRSLAGTLAFDSGSPLKRQAGRARRLSGMALPFARVYALKQRLGGCMIDAILTIMARAIGRWHEDHGIDGVDELMTLVPVSLRKPEEWTRDVPLGNAATGILVRLPIRLRGPLLTHREICRRMAERKADPASTAVPALSEMMSVLPRPLLGWMSESMLFGNVDFIVTNVPGILVPRYLAGSEILAAYPFAPVAVKSPVSVALYGYRDSLFLGITSDESIMPDVEVFQRYIGDAFAELEKASMRPPRRESTAGRA